METFGVVLWCIRRPFRGVRGAFVLPGDASHICACIFMTCVYLCIPSINQAASFLNWPSERWFFSGVFWSNYHDMSMGIADEFYLH